MTVFVYICRLRFASDISNIIIFSRMTCIATQNVHALYICCIRLGLTLVLIASLFSWSDLNFSYGTHDGTTRRHGSTWCSGECVRLKNFVVHAEITGNTITTCGVHDYKFGDALTDTDADKNGEGIYIGTSINQVGGDGGIVVRKLYYDSWPLWFWLDITLCNTRPHAYSQQKVALLYILVNSIAPAYYKRHCWLHTKCTTNYIM